MIRKEDFYGGAHYQSVGTDTAINGWWRVMVFNVTAPCSVTFLGEDLAKRFDFPFLGGGLAYIFNVGSALLTCSFDVNGTTISADVPAGNVLTVCLYDANNYLATAPGVTPAIPAQLARSSTLSAGVVMQATAGIVHNGNAGTSTQKVAMPTGTWSALAASPSIHGDSAGFGLAQGLHLLGNQSTGKTSHSRYRDAAWSSRSNTPIDLKGATGGVLRSIGYVFTAQSDLALASKPIATYDYTDLTDAYSAKASMPHPTQQGAGASVPAFDRIMLVRGSPQNQASWLYHGPSGTFESVALYGGSPRRSQSAFQLYGKVYAVAGFDEDATAYTDRTEVFDIATRSWSVGPTLPAQRRHGCGFAWHQVGVYAGGQDNTGTATATVFRLNTTASWSTGTTKTTTNQRSQQHGAEIRV